MSLASEYRRQFPWRDWEGVFRELPPLAGRTVIDLGCGVGDQAAELAARGARVIGVDLNEELIGEAARGIANAEFRCGDLKATDELGVVVDGIWSSFAAAYFAELSAALTMWARRLRPGGWIALTEIDDLFGHEPLSAETRAVFEAYAGEALSAGRYDFHMGRKLRAHLERSGYSVTKEWTVRDKELSFDGPAIPEVIEGWRTRLERMKLLQEACGAGFGRLRDEFLGCLAREDHRSVARVCCCIGVKRV